MRRDKWQTKHLEKPRDIPGQCNHLYIPQSSKIVPFSWSDCLKRHSLICSALIFLMPGNLGDKRVMKILGWVRSPSPQHMSWRTLAVTWCLQVAKFFVFFFFISRKGKTRNISLSSGCELSEEIQASPLIQGPTHSKNSMNVGYYF